MTNKLSVEEALILIENHQIPDPKPNFKTRSGNLAYVEFDYSCGWNNAYKFSGFIFKGEKKEYNSWTKEGKIWLLKEREGDLVEYIGPEFSEKEKWEIPGLRTKIFLPINSQILSIDHQIDIFFLWARFEVENKEVLTEVEILPIFPGQYFQEDNNEILSYICTKQVGGQAFHFFKCAEIPF